MNLAIFDLDHTLITCDSDNEWPRYLMEKGVVDRAFVEKKNDYFYQQYLDGCLNVPEFLAFQLEPLTRFSRQELDEMHQEFMQGFIEPYITAEALALVENHQKAGDVVMLLSATNEFIIRPIGQRFGIEEIIGVTLETDEKGDYTGGYIGVPSYQEGKITRLQEWLDSRGKTKADYEHIYFYSDSRNDLPLLKWVDRPVAVNPDDVLEAYAQEQGWPIIRFA